MPRAILFLALAILASSVRADDVSEAALAGRWKVVGTAPTAKNRDGLAELEKHGCYLYFEFAASGRAAIGIGSDSKAKLAALKKANPDVELEWAAKYEVVNGRVEVSGFPARLREPGGWLGDSATALFRVRLDGDTLELTGPGGFVAFQKVKKTVAATGGATGTKAKPKADANPLAGRWRAKKIPNAPLDYDEIYKRNQVYVYADFAADGTVKYDSLSEDPDRTPLNGGFTAKYRVGPENALEIYDAQTTAAPRFRRGMFDGKYTFVLNGDALTLTEFSTAQKFEYVRYRPFDPSKLVGAWRVTETSRQTKADRDLIARTGVSTYLVYAKDGTAKLELRDRDGQLIPGARPPQGYWWHYRVVSATEIEYTYVPQDLRNEAGPAGLKDSGTVTYKLTGDTLVITEVDGKNTLTLEREKK